MQINPALQIQTLIKAMTEDVIPALDPTNQLAMQSAQLTVGTLALLSQHIPLQLRYDSDQLTRLLRTAQRLCDRMRSDRSVAEAAAKLEAAVETARAAIGQSRIEPPAVSKAIQLLRTAICAALRSIYSAENAVLIAATEPIILESSKEQLLRDRSWLLLQGWEPDPASVPPIEQLLSHD